MPPCSAVLGQLFRLTCPLPDAELLRRWIERRDQDAFTALVTRHGRMVFNVCRRVLGNTHDAEDVFQAVFLILARKAATLHHPEALAGWLHGVAVRLTYKARTAARRCSTTDSLAAEPCDPHPDPLDALSARELMGLIDQEIARLPEVYRLPLVLCDLEERTQPEAARLLGWTLGSFRGRLLRGRERLRARLARRGIAPAVLAAVSLHGTADAAGLTANVSRLAGQYANCPASAEIPASVAALVREGIRSLVLTKLKLASIILLAASTLIAGVGLLAWPTPTALPQAEERAEDKPQSAKPRLRRDQVGDPLPAEALSRLGTLRFRHGGVIRSLAFASDGKSLVSHSRDGIRFWDTATGEEIQRFPEQSNAQSMALSPDGKILAIRRITNRLNRDNSKEKGIAIREFATGRLLRLFGDWQTPWLIAFSPDSKMLAAHFNSLDIELWDPASGRRLQTLKGHERVVGSIAFSADGKTLVSGSHDKTIRFWDTATGKELRQIKLSNEIAEIALSPDSKLLASVEFIPHINDVFGGSTVLYHDNHVRLWDAATGKELRQLTMPPKKEYRKVRDGFHRLRFAPDGKTLLTSGADGKLRVWDPATGKELRQIASSGDGLGAFALSPDGKSVAVVDGLLTIRLLDFASGKDLVPSLGHRDRVSSISVLPDDRTIATTSQDGTLRFWEATTGRQLHQRAVSVNFTAFTGLRADGRTYLTVGPDEICRLNDLASGKELAILHGHESPFPFALSPDGKTLASVNADKEVRLLDPATGAVRHLLTKVKSHVLGMTFTKDGRTLVVWDADFIVTIWDAATGKLQRRFTAIESGIPAPFRRGKGILLYIAALSPDGKRMAFGIQVIGSKEYILPVIETTRGKIIRRITTAEDGACWIAFSPDSKSLAWSGWLSTPIYIGEIASGRVRRRFEGHKGHINSLAFSADGKMLVSGSLDTTALVWDLTGRLAMGKKYGAALSAGELESHGKTLASDDAEAAFRAMQVLAADPARSVPYLRKQLHPIGAADEKRLQQWIADLDSDQFAVREKATAELEKLGAAALNAMRKALDGKPALETRRRLEPLLEKLEREEWPTSGEKLRIWRALEVLERAGTPEAKDVLAALAKGAPGARQTMEARAALQRLAQRAADSSIPKTTSTPK